jgi:hypothetical protein
MDEFKILTNNHVPYLKQIRLNYRRHEAFKSSVIHAYTQGSKLTLAHSQNARKKDCKVSYKPLVFFANKEIVKKNELYCLMRSTAWTLNRRSIFWTSEYPYAEARTLFVDWYTYNTDTQMVLIQRTWNSRLFTLKLNPVLTQRGVHYTVYWQLTFPVKRECNKAVSNASTSFRYNSVD